MVLVRSGFQVTEASAPSPPDLLLYTPDPTVGGDEFACVLPETDGTGGRHFVERLRQVFARHTFADLGPAKMPGISAGVIAYPHSEALRPEDLFTLAEGALQSAKSGAPDRIAVVGEG
ncbi:MAG TPA: diguanylate cyclase [Gemmatimonadales bacterium]|nr:diguanylate cyclase [Gemmatimonadales bacterium]